MMVRAQIQCRHGQYLIAMSIVNMALLSIVTVVAELILLLASFGGPGAPHNSDFALQFLLGLAMAFGLD